MPLTNPSSTSLTNCYVSLLSVINYKKMFVYFEGLPSFFVDPSIPRRRSTRQCFKEEPIVKPQIPTPVHRLFGHRRRGGEGRREEEEKMRRSVRNPGRTPAPVPLEPLKEGHRIDPLERIFLEATERGDKHSVIRCLQGPKPVNVNCTNMLGRSAIQVQTLLSIKTRTPRVPGCLPAQLLA